MSGTDGNPQRRPRPAEPNQPGPPAMPPASWAKRTGFKGRVSGESISGDSGQLLLSRPAKTPEVVPDLEAGRPRPTPPPASAAAPINGGDKAKNERTAAASTPVGDQPPKRRKNSDGGEGKGLGVNGNGTRKSDPPPPKSRREEDPVSLAQVPEEDDFVGRRPHINYDLRDSPGLGDCSSLPRPSNQCRCRCRIISARFICYGLIDFFFFVLGSTYPSVWVSALSVHDGIDRPHSSGHRPRHGRHLREQRAIPVFFFWNFLLEHSKLVHLIFHFQDDTSAVVSTVLFVSGLTTLLNSLFGSRLPLVQGPSFVYLAPALAIINSPEFLALTANVQSSALSFCPQIFPTLRSSGFHTYPLFDDISSRPASN